MSEEEYLQPEDTNTQPDGGAGSDPSPSEQAIDRAMESQESAADSIASLKQQLADAEKRILLAHADMENYRKRARRDMQDQAKYACLDLMQELLESVDNLHRAWESYQTEPNGDGLAEGVKMVAQQITRTLENHGCKRIEAVGHAFDPNLHQALQMQPSEEHPANTVIADLRSGFRLHDRLVRPSQVFVSTGQPAAGNE